MACEELVASFAESGRIRQQEVQRLFDLYEASEDVCEQDELVCYAGAYVEEAKGDLRWTSEAIEFYVKLGHLEPAFGSSQFPKLDREDAWAWKEELERNVITNVEAIVEDKPVEAIVEDKLRLLTGVDSRSSQCPADNQPHPSFDL